MQYHCERFAVKYEPAMVVVELIDGERSASGPKKRSLLKFSLEKCLGEMSVMEMIAYIKERLEVKGAEMNAKDRRNLNDVVQHLNDRFEASQLVAKGDDLNQVSMGVLEQAKECMNQKFNENAVKPGDPGFIYNKKVEFAAAADENELSDNSWDEDEE